MNVLLISPHFPPNYYQFAVGLSEAGATVLAIGDLPYAALAEPLREALTEYYWVDNQHNYDRVMRGCAFFIHKYGRLDCLESHNEYWLESDARLRSDFNIPGLRDSDIAWVKRKSQMKQRFLEAGIAVARWQLASTLAAARSFVAEVGYPIIAKPDVGVGATATYRINNEPELARFFAEKPFVDYLLEEFIFGELHSYDGLTDQDGRQVFTTAHRYQPGILEVVNEDLDVAAWSLREIPAELAAAGARAVKAFNVRARFFHIEFFREPASGRWLAVEMNIRPPGGLMVDLMNYANDIDLYAQWANVVLFNSFTQPLTRPYHCAFVGRKQHRPYRYSHEEVLELAAPLLIHHQRLEPLFIRAMGDYAYVLRSPDLDALQQTIRIILQLQ
ncbi:MAG: argininosuccinate lyase [Chloroflexi bacterium ADurb.Bin222]|nr:MAG: argininosuccinate lyase [Chloroflexi bacterium ADurb.Bin222]